MNDDDALPPLDLESEEIITDSIRDYANRKKFTKVFRTGYSWDISSISVLLNELVDWKVENKFRTRDRNDGLYFVFHFISNDADKDEIVVSLRSDCYIEVKMTTRTLLLKWSHQQRRSATTVDKYGRKLPETIFKTVDFFTEQMLPKTDGSRVIILKRLAIFYNLSSYSKVFIYFCKKAAKRITLLRPEDTVQFMDIYNTWLKHSKSMSCTTEQSFLSTTEGYLKFYVSDKLFKNKVHVTLDKKEYSIISGIYISPLAESIISQNQEITDGILMDTTWKVLPYYVTSILMLSICNVGIPVSFCFGKAETADLYEMFFKAFNEILHIDISKYVIESDKGTALAAICAKYKCRHIGCLRHFIARLGLLEYSKQISELVSAKCKSDFERLRLMYSERFAKYIDTPDLDPLQKMLGKAGLNYDVQKKQIVIANEETWKNISQIERIELCMPSTTNALEASHGHLNGKVPRHNDFWTAMKRMVNFTLNKENNFEASYKANYYREERKVKETMRMNREAMQDQLKSYESTPSTCKCGETKLLSKMFRIDIPCSHMFYLKREYPKPPEIKLKLAKSIQKLVILKEELEMPDNSSQYTLQSALQSKASRVIRKYSHFKDVALIQNSLPTIEIGEHFANGLPMSYHEAVATGIEEFTRKKKEDSKK